LLKSRHFDDAAPQQCLDMRLLYDSWRLGPGSSNGISGTHFADKIVQDWTCTRRALPFVRQLRRLVPRLRLYDELNGSGITVIEGSRVITVPKNEDTDRTIAIEPIGNMALQLAAGVYIESALSHLGLHLATQQFVNRELTKVGSSCGKYATLDLKSASDLITPDLIRLLWPPEWFELLSVLRSSNCQLEGSNDWTVLFMMSTMGNGFTFPMMTMTLLALVYAALRSVDKSCKRNKIPSGVGVFGDDIICPTLHVEVVLEVLGGAGLSVNFDKSHYKKDDLFRESCGLDMYNGYDVTPFYVKSLANNAEIYVAINQLLAWSARHDFKPWRSFGVLLAGLERPPFPRAYRRRLHQWYSLPNRPFTL